MGQELPETKVGPRLHSELAESDDPEEKRQAADLTQSNAEKKEKRENLKKEQEKCNKKCEEHEVEMKDRTKVDSGISKPVAKESKPYDEVCFLAHDEYLETEDPPFEDNLPCKHVVKRVLMKTEDDCKGGKDENKNKDDEENKDVKCTWPEELQKSKQQNVACLQLIKLDNPEEREQQEESEKCPWKIVDDKCVKEKEDGEEVESDGGTKKDESCKMLEKLGFDIPS